MSAAGEVVGGKYRLQLRLGAGGMGEVWSATNRFTERQVAIKLLSRDIADKQADAKQRFLNEAKVSARVDHPNIVDVIDVGQTDDGRLFLVMELLAGVSLETALRRQMPRMTLRELAIVMLDVAGALEAAHSAGIVHRDLKPSNIFLHKDKNRVIPTVLDFGVSKFLTRKDGEAAQAITLAGTVLGSPLYMSPEQARGEMQLDGRTDIFAFGGILFEALTGFRAFEAANFNALIVKIATGRPKNIDEHAPQLPEGLRQVVKTCLEPDLAKRARKFEDVIFLIRAALPQLAVDGPRLPPAQTPVALLDTDATNALPMFTPSGRIPLAPTQRLESTAYEASLPPREVEAAPPASNASPWLVVACTAVIIGCLALFAPSGALLLPPPSEPSTASVPAATTAQLAIAAQPSCSVRVDGSERGSTPMTIDLTPGDHVISCSPPGKTARSAKVTVRAGSLSRYRFLFDD